MGIMYSWALKGLWFIFCNICTACDLIQICNSMLVVNCEGVTNHITVLTMELFRVFTAENFSILS